jgi:hypothetical protein
MVDNGCVTCRTSDTKICQLNDSKNVRSSDLLHQISFVFLWKKKIPTPDQDVLHFFLVTARNQNLKEKGHE